MRHYLGIDGGGTKTKAVLCDEEFNVISAYTGKSINFNSTGINEARKALADIFDSVLKEKGITPHAVCIGCAALSSRADSILTEKLLGGITECRNIILDSDIFTALEAMRVDGPCAAAICGTGSMAAGRTESGEIITCFVKIVPPRLLAAAPHWPGILSHRSLPLNLREPYTFAAPPKRGSVWNK